MVHLLRLMNQHLSLTSLTVNYSSHCNGFSWVFNLISLYFLRCSDFTLYLSCHVSGVSIACHGVTDIPGFGRPWQAWGILVRSSAGWAAIVWGFDLTLLSLHGCLGVGGGEDLRLKCSYHHSPKNILCTWPCSLNLTLIPLLGIVGLLPHYPIASPLSPSHRDPLEGSHHTQLMIKECRGLLSTFF